MIVETYTAGPLECVRLDDRNGLTLFKLADSDSCGGPNCLHFSNGQTAYALEKIKPGEPAQWSFWRGSCADILFCEGEPVCDEHPELCGPPPNP